MASFLRKIFLFIFLFFVSLFGIFLFFSQKTIEIVPSQNISFDENLPLKEESKNENSNFLWLISDVRDDLILKKENFLEINFSQMKVKLYKEGKVTKEVEILAKGDPQGWGGTPQGIYKILAKNKLGYSIVSEVYMPYALHFYGKYWIHGEPYYPGGKKLISSVSGGCVRVKDKDAKEIYELSEVGMPVVVIEKEKDNFQPANLKISNFPEISAQSYLVADLDSGFVFAEKNSKEKFPIASLTKLMTAIVVVENVDLRKSILVTSKMLNAHGSTKGLEAGKSFRVVELLYPLLIESSNDAAEVLSYFLGKENTIKMMNEKTKAILMENTKFVDPSGFDPENVSTARDLFQLAKYITETRPTLWKITKGEKVRSFGEISFDVQNLWNKNVFYQDPNFEGGKTGFIKESRYTGIFIFKFLTKEGTKRKIVIILLKSEKLKEDTQKIYKWIEENFSLSPAVK